MEPQTSSTQSLNTKYIIVGVALLVLSSAIGAVLGGVLFSSNNGNAEANQIVEKADYEVLLL